MIFRCVLLALSSSAALFGASSANATVSFGVNAINEISLSGNPATLTINSATAGSNPTSASDSSTTYSITTNQTSKVITGSIDSNMPSGLTLSISLIAPSGATSAGSVAMTTTPQNLVTSISSVAQSSLGITYVLSASSLAASQGPLMRTVTYTIGP